MAILRILVKQANRYATLGARLGCVNHPNSDNQCLDPNNVEVKRNKSDKSITASASTPNACSRLAESVLGDVGFAQSLQVGSTKRRADVYQGTIDFGDSRSMGLSPNLGAYSPSTFGVTTPDVAHVSSSYRSPSISQINSSARNGSEGRQRSSSQPSALKPCGAGLSISIGRYPRYAGLFSSLICPAYYNGANIPSALRDSLTPIYPLAFCYCFYVAPCLYIIFPSSRQKIVLNVGSLGKGKSIFSTISNHVGSSVVKARESEVLFNMRAPLCRTHTYLLPKVDSAERAVDDCMQVLYRIIGADKLIFLLNCVLLQQSVLFIAPTGSEELIAKSILGFIDISMGHLQEYVCMPLLGSEVARDFLRREASPTISESFPVVESEIRPFIAGTYHSILESITASHTLNVESNGKEMELSPDEIDGDSCIHHGYLNRDYSQEFHYAEAFSYHHELDFTVVDLLSGHIWPGKKMRFAAAITAPEWKHGSPGSRIDGHSGEVARIFARLQENGKTRTSNYFPPLPPRIRDVMRGKNRSPTSNETTEFEGPAVFSFLSAIHTAVSEMLFLLPQFCKIVSVFDDGYICECYGSNFFSESVDDSRSSENPAVIVIRTAVDTLFDIKGSKKDGSVIGRNRNCVQFSGYSTLNMLAASCTRLNIKLNNSISTLRSTFARPVENDNLPGKCCLCCKYLGRGHEENRKRRLWGILFNDDAFIASTRCELRPFLLQYCQLRSFDLMMVSSLLGVTGPVKLFDARKSAISPLILPEEHNRILGQACYPSNYLRMLLSPHLVMTERLKYIRVAGYLYVCVVRITSRFPRELTTENSLTHTLPIEVVTSDSASHALTFSEVRGNDAVDFEIEDLTDYSSESGYGSTVGKVELSRFKKRWCILDGYSFSYYKQNSEDVVKGSVLMNRNVKAEDNMIRLLSPIYKTSSNAPSEIPTIFGLDNQKILDASKKVHSNSSGNPELSEQVRDIILLYSPDAPYKNAQVVDDTVHSQLGSAKTAYKKISNSKGGVGPAFDTTTNKWVDAFRARLSSRD